MSIINQSNTNSIQGSKFHRVAVWQLQAIPYKHTTCISRWNDMKKNHFHGVLTWITLSVFVRMRLKIRGSCLTCKIVGKRLNVWEWVEVVEWNKDGPLLSFITVQKWSFPLGISPVNVTRSAVSCGFGYIYWRYP